MGPDVAGAYTYPTPNSYPEYPVRPGEAYYSTELGEFLLPYEAVLPDFLESTYDAAAATLNWDRGALEADPDRLDQYR